LKRGDHAIGILLGSLELAVLTEQNRVELFSAEDILQANKHIRMSARA
jgi:hypothetical protein